MELPPPWKDGWRQRAKQYLETALLRLMLTTLDKAIFNPIYTFRKEWVYSRILIGQAYSILEKNSQDQALHFFFKWQHIHSYSYYFDLLLPMWKDYNIYWTFKACCLCIYSFYSFKQRITGVASFQIKNRTFTIWNHRMA